LPVTGIRTSFRKYLFVAIICMSLWPVIIEVEKNRATRQNKENDDIVVNIKDDGAGIDPEVMPRLFSKFVSTFTQGTGLGLFISKSIIEAHGGRLWAKNNDEGKGAIFMFSLPSPYHTID
jgi:signal transduction histidine kinase